MGRKTKVKKKSLQSLNSVFFMVAHTRLSLMVSHRFIYIYIYNSTPTCCFVGKQLQVMMGTKSCNFEKLQLRQKGAKSLKDTMREFLMNSCIHLQMRVEMSKQRVRQMLRKTYLIYLNPPTSNERKNKHNKTVP